jgi:hypothetical protein
MHLAYNIVGLNSNVFVTVSHFHPIIIFEVKARSFLRVATGLAVKYWTRVEIVGFRKCT